MTPPTMAGWNLALRFGLELGALAGMAFAGWTLTPGPARWAAATLAPVTAAIIWGVFNVVDDPSRSGAAPVEVSGWVRLAIELVVLGGAAGAITVAGHRNIGIAFAVLIVFHSAASSSRIEWLIGSDGAVAPRSAVVDP